MHSGNSTHNKGLHGQDREMHNDNRAQIRGLHDLGREMHIDNSAYIRCNVYSTLIQISK